MQYFVLGEQWLVAGSPRVNVGSDSTVLPCCGT